VARLAKAASAAFPVSHAYVVGFARIDVITSKHVIFRVCLGGDGAEVDGPKSSLQFW
jgi:hypothetical protein